MKDESASICFRCGHSHDLSRTCEQATSDFLSLALPVAAELLRLGAIANIAIRVNSSEMVATCEKQGWQAVCNGMVFAVWVRVRDVCPECNRVMDFSLYGGGGRRAFCAPIGNLPDLSAYESMEAFLAAEGSDTGTMALSPFGRGLWMAVDGKTGKESL